MTQEWMGQARDFFRKPRKAGGIGVVGDLAWDRFISGSVDRISPEAPVPVLLAERTVDLLGCAGNVLANLAAYREILDFELKVFGVVGNDEAGKRMTSALADLGKGIEAVVLKDASRPTTVKTRFLTGSHQFLRVDTESTEAIPQEIVKKLLSETDAALSSFKCLVVQDYAKGVLSKDFLPKLLEKARLKKVFTLVDPNPGTPAERYTGASLITPNVAESEALLGRPLHKGANNDEMAQACRDLKKKLKLEMCLITRSGHGMTLLDDTDAIFHFPAVSRAVFDVTGAGDTVVASLAAGLAGGLSIQAACVVATAAASVVVAKVGTATASPREVLEEIEHFSSR